MNEGPFSRMEMLFGPLRMARLAACHVLLFGVGGVGGHCAEALARCGIGRFTLVDGDTVAPSNLNRQAVALHSTIGRAKVAVMRDRMLDVNPCAEVRAVNGFYLPRADLGLWDGADYDLVIDAVDTVLAKVDIALSAQRLGIPCLSSMGAGNKLDPMRFEASDLYQTSVCPLCRATRKLAREQGVRELRVVYSKEPPVRLQGEGGRVPGSVGYVTAAAGLAVASEAVRLLLAGDMPV